MTLFLFIITFLLPIVQPNPPLAQNTIIVDIKGNGDYTSIKEAIQNSKATDIILIKEGIYKEHSININKKIIVTGDVSRNSIIDCSGNIGFTLNSPYVDISNLKIINSGEYAIAITPNNVGSIINNCSISTKGNEIGIDVRSSNNRISDCSITSNNRGKQGVKISSSRNIVEDCNIQSFGNGILVLIKSRENKIINCNIINCESGIDIRINSDNNTVNNCNIYYNILGMRIWQGSDDNLIYRNNFWRNEKQADDHNSNNWDNGVYGNYWDDYTGEDTNGDGIGNTPYIISEENSDRFPFVNIILPEEISIPGGLKLVSSTSNNLTSFIWNPSIYKKDIKGYYVRIDNNEDVFVAGKTNWTSPYEVSDGVHTFYVKAVGVDNSTSDYASLTFSIDTVFIDSDDDGWSDEEEILYDTDPNDTDNYPQDTDGDRIPDTSDTDDDNDGYPDEMEMSYGSNTKIKNSHPIDTDNDYIPDEGSPDGKFIGDRDDDFDGLSDQIERDIGSNPKDSTDVTRIYILGKSYFLIDASREGIYDVLYNPSNGKITTVELQGDNYLIDKDGDNTWDHIYKISEGSVKQYGEDTYQLPLFTLFVIIIVITIILVYLYRFKPRKIKTYRTVDKTIKPPPLKRPSKAKVYDKDTAEMLIQTKTLLQNIQRDVQVYLDKLDEIEDQSLLVTLEDDEKQERKISQEEHVTQVETKKKQKTGSEIEEEIDKLLSKSKDNNED
jgi:nitrous oxidase accessory protein NosD